jgi:hypothetical protein
MKSSQKAALTVLGTLIAVAGGFLWLVGYGMSTCGPNEAIMALGGLGVLAVLVTALWVSTSRSRTGTVPLLAFGAVAAVSLYMIFGRAPGC